MNQIVLFELESDLLFLHQLILVFPIGVNIVKHLLYVMNCIVFAETNDVILLEALPTKRMNNLIVQLRARNRYQK